MIGEEWLQNVNPYFSEIECICASYKKLLHSKIWPFMNIT